MNKRFSCFFKNKKLCRFLLSTAFVFNAFICFAQTDTIQKKSEHVELKGAKNATAISDSAQKKIQYHSPKKAALFSAIIPGAGQVYNKKYWKLPIVYGALGAVGYLAYKKQDSLNKINRDLDARFDKDTNTTIIYTRFSDEQMLTAYDATAKKRDLFFIIGIAVYALQIVDAAVDAHLFYFDVSDDLSLKIEPDFRQLNYAQQYSFSSGVKLSLRF